MRSLREYNQVTREPTRMELLAIKAAADNLQIQHKRKTVTYLVQTALFVLFSTIVIRIVSPNISIWFRYFLITIATCMTSYLLYDCLSRYLYMKTSLNKVMQGECRVANGNVKSFYSIMSGYTVEGEIGELSKAIVQFNIDRDFIESENADKTFLCFMTSMQVYILALLPNGGKIVTDDADVYELETVS